MTTSTPAHLFSVMGRMRPTLAILAMAYLLAACAMAPGMRMGAKTQYGGATEDAEPAGPLTPITPALITQQRKAAGHGVDKALKRLIGTTQASHNRHRASVNTVQLADH